MERKVNIGKFPLIKGSALICIPISGKNKEELYKELEALKNSEFDFAEWRIDFLEEDLADCYKFIKEKAGFPLLVTCRTKKEGGNGDMEASEYCKLIKEIISLKPEVVDIELSSGYGEALCREAKEKGVTTIISYHNFKYAESDAEILSIIEKMRETQADIYKLALTPLSFSETLRILNINSKLSESDFPLLLIAMGEIGKATRILCNQSGAAFTFASAYKGSAPGQMEASFVKNILDELK